MPACTEPEPEPLEPNCLDGASTTSRQFQQRIQPTRKDRTPHAKLEPRILAWDATRHRSDDRSRYANQARVHVLPGVRYDKLGIAYRCPSMPSNGCAERRARRGLSQALYLSRVLSSGLIDGVTSLARVEFCGRSGVVDYHQAMTTRRRG